jgi:hypothetical protein
VGTISRERNRGGAFKKKEKEKAQISYVNIALLPILKNPVHENMFLPE